MYHSKKHIDKSADSLIRLTEVLKRTGLSRTTLYELIKQGNFPRQIKLGRTSLWSESEVSSFIEEAKAGRVAA
jgi:prophage regulatory protein